MNIHEYQAKKLLSQFGIPVMPGGVAASVDTAYSIAHKLGGKIWAVKAQIHAGGRGKGGGIHLARSLAQVKQHAEEILGMQLVTPQTGPTGQKVRKVYIEKASDIAHEYYFSFLIDRAQGCILALASPEGGMNIEEVAAKNPRAVLKLPIDIITGFCPHHGRALAYFLGFGGDMAKSAIQLFGKLYKLFTQTDAALIEINPLVRTKKGELLPLDAKISFDDNALFRLPKIQALYDRHEEDPAEVKARAHDLNYVKLDGNIGCMVNGAGLAMATMDIIQLKGGKPANFLDVGGGATKERVTTAFELILSEKNVQGILVNIFGGIMRCDIIAEGIVAAAKKIKIAVPLVVRLQGTNVTKGREILAKSKLNIEVADQLDEAATKIVAAVKGTK